MQSSPSPLASRGRSRWHPLIGLVMLASAASAGNAVQAAAAAGDGIDIGIVSAVAGTGDAGYNGGAA